MPDRHPVKAGQLSPHPQEASTPCSGWRPAGDVKGTSWDVMGPWALLVLHLCTFTSKICVVPSGSHHKALTLMTCEG